jgi:hypothetical protein
MLNYVKNHMTQAKSFWAFNFATWLLLVLFKLPLINKLINSVKHMCMHACACEHTHMHACTRMCTHARAHTHTHTQNALSLTQAEIHVTFLKITFPFIHFYLTLKCLGIFYETPQHKMLWKAIQWFLSCSMITNCESETCNLYHNKHY